MHEKEINDMATNFLSISRMLFLSLFLGKERIKASCSIQRTDKGLATKREEHAGSVILCCTKEIIKGNGQTQNITWNQQLGK